jgi:hypothetical protein
MRARHFLKGTVFRTAENAWVGSAEQAVLKIGMSAALADEDKFLIRRAPLDIPFRIE